MASDYLCSRLGSTEAWFFFGSLGPRHVRDEALPLEFYGAPRLYGAMSAPSYVAHAELGELLG